MTVPPSPLKYFFTFRIISENAFGLILPFPSGTEMPRIDCYQCSPPVEFFWSLFGVVVRPFLAPASRRFFLRIVKTGFDFWKTAGRKLRRQRHEPFPQEPNKGEWKEKEENCVPFDVALTIFDPSRTCLQTAGIITKAASTLSCF